MNVLITNIVLSGRTGTEIVTRDLALGLLRAGHSPTIYTPSPGALAETLREAGVPVVSDIDAVEETPDVIHGHHNSATATAVARFPDTPALFVCHDLFAWHDTPPLLPSIRRHVAISEGFRRRLTAEGVPQALTRVVLNGIDLDRFRPGPPPPARPARALAFAKNAEHLAAVEAACARLDITLDVIGTAVGRIDAAPEQLLPGYDLVFASALSAIEAMACGRPVVVCDGRGLAGFVDMARYEGWRAENFGLAVLTQALTPDTVAAEIANYDTAAAARVSERLRAEAGLDPWAGHYLALYEEIIAQAAAQPSDRAAHDRAMARHLQAWGPRVGPEWPWMAESERLGQEQERRRTGLRLLPWGEAAAPAMDEVLRLTGFHTPEPWGAWSRTRAPVVMLRPPPSRGPVSLALSYAVYLTEARPTFEVSVLANGLEVAAWCDEVRDTALRSRVIVLPPEVLEGCDGLTLQFRTSAPGSPIDDGGTDPRRLGLGIVSLTLTPL
ncbi:MAG: hypothetical protein JWP35_2466 [Caulobacter sp.]|nr:hypothetical protein [Caulobacter sp.]